MIFEDWGLVEYESSSKRQLEYVDAVAKDSEEKLVFCTHPPVVTLGRGTKKEEDLIDWNGPLLETSRGGRATYHGPSQIVIYPILNLKARALDIHAYLRLLEQTTVLALAEADLPGCEVRTTTQGENSLTGVWIGPKKIASVGIAVRKWISYHGVAINVLNDPQAHKGIRPCGFSSNVMTSLEAELGRPVEIEKIKSVFASVYNSRLSR